MEVEKQEQLVGSSANGDESPETVSEPKVDGAEALPLPETLNLPVRKGHLLIREGDYDSCPEPATAEAGPDDLEGEPKADKSSKAKKRSKPRKAKAHAPQPPMLDSVKSVSVSKPEPPPQSAKPTPTMGPPPPPPQSAKPKPDRMYPQLLTNSQSSTTEKSPEPKSTGIYPQLSTNSQTAEKSNQHASLSHTASVPQSISRAPPRDLPAHRRLRSPERKLSLDTTAFRLPPSLVQQQQKDFAGSAHALR